MSTRSLRENIKLLTWYLKRPPMYSEMMRALGRMPRSTSAVRAELERVMVEARRWCCENASTEEELARDLGVPEQVPPIAEVHPEAWSCALRSAEACAVKMGGAGHVDLLYHLCVHLRPSSVLETGVAYGWSSLAILLALNDIGRGSLVSIDRPYPGLDNEKFVGCVVPTALRGRWRLVRRPDRDALPSVLKKSGAVDLAHYDSDKSYAGRIFAYSLIWKSLNPGGVLISDDVGDNFGFRDFAEGVCSKPYIIDKFARGGSGFAGLLVKPLSDVPVRANGVG